MDQSGRNFPENGRLEAFSLIVLLVIGGGFLLAWPVRRVNRRLGDGLSLVAHLAARLATIIIAGWAAIQAIEDGTISHVAVGVLLLLVVAGAIFMSVVVLLRLAQTIRGSQDNADS